MNVRIIAAGLLIAVTTSIVPATISAQEHFTRREAVIAAVQGSSLTLRDGHTLFLRQGTVINPKGQTLRAGQRIAFSGTRDDRGRIIATEIDVFRRR